MLSGWVKLQRQTMENQIFHHDFTAWHIFEVLLMVCDSKTGTWEGGRFQLAELCKMNANTLYKALLRLQKAKMVTLSSNTKYTKIYICNWSKYQSGGNRLGNTPSNTPSNTLTRSKELKNNIDKSILATTPYGKPEINELFEYWQERTGIPISSQIKANRNACNNLIKKHGKDGVARLIEGVAQSQGDQYAPRIADFVQLQAKLSQLLLWGKQNVTAKKVARV